MAETLNNSTSSRKILTMTTKRSDNVACDRCSNGTMIPVNENAKLNHCFKCSHCGTRVNFDTIVDIE